MATVVMPKLGESVTEGTLGRWLKSVGDTVEKYEPLAEVITDKVTAEVPSDFVGVLAEILVQEGETVGVGTVIATIVEQGELTRRPVMTEAAAEGTPVCNAAVDSRRSAPMLAEKRYSPAVRRLAHEAKVDLSMVQGTGLGGRVTRRDVLQYIEQKKVAQGVTPESLRSASVQTIGRQLGQSNADPAYVGPQAQVGMAQRASAADVDRFDERVPITPVRHAIARHMVESKHEAPHAWTMVEVDVTSLVRFRDKIKGQFKQREGYDLTYLPFFIKCVVESLKEHPMMNSQWADDHILVHRDVHISLAVATKDALFVPVIFHADHLSIAGIAGAVSDLAARARSGKLTVDELKGGTFTVNNTGAFGSVLSYPIINYPQAAILSVESIVRRPVVVGEDSIAIRSMVNLCLSVDHRILDGWIAGQFLRSVKQKLEAIGDQTSIY